MTCKLCGLNCRVLQRCLDEVNALPGWILKTQDLLPSKTGKHVSKILQALRYIQLPKTCR